MADPKTPLLPKQLTEETPLVEFSKTGNLYVDPAYTAQGTPATSPITEEDLTYGTNAVENLTKNSNNSPDYNLAVPGDGNAIFVTNLKRNVQDGNGNHMFFSYKRAGNKLYDVYIKDSTGWNFSASPRAVANYTADSDGTLNVYIEGCTFGGNLMGFGSQTNLTQTFTGNYELTFKNSRVQWFAITYGTGYGLGERGNGNNRFGTVIGNIDLLVDGSTITNNGAVLRGGIHGAGEEKAYVRAVFKDTLDQNQFGIVMTGSDNNNNDAADDANFKSFADFDITITGSTYTNGFMMFPNASASGTANSGENAVTGDVTFKMTGSTIANGLVLGAGQTGANNNGRGQFNGNIDFEIKDSTVTGELMFNKGTMSSATTPGKITGKIDGSSVANVLGFWTGGTGNLNYTDVEVSVSNSTIGNFDVGHVYDDKIIGVVDVDFAGSTVGRIWTDRRYNDNTHDSATYNLVFNAAENATKVTGGDGIRAWDTITVKAGATVEGTLLDGKRKVGDGKNEAPTVITVEAGASLRLTGALSNAASVTLNGADLLSASTLSDIVSLSVVDASLTEGEVVLVSGVSSYNAEEPGIAKVTVNGAELSYGVFGGQYSLVGTDLVAHLGTTYLVNTNYSGNGIQTALGLTGYKDISVAQEAAKNGATIAFTTLDIGLPEEAPIVDAPTTFTSDFYTKGVAAQFAGQEDDGDNAITLDGNKIIVGDNSKVDSAEVRASYIKGIGGVLVKDADTSLVLIDSSEFTSDAAIDMAGAKIGDAKVDISNVKSDKLASVTAAGAEIGKTDFSLANATVGTVAFTDAKLGDATVTLNTVKVEDDDIDMSGASFGAATITMSDIDAEGYDLDMSNTTFTDASIDLNKVNLADGVIDLSGIESAKTDLSVKDSRMSALVLNGAKLGEATITLTGLDLAEQSIDLGALTMTTAQITLDDTKIKDLKFATTATGKLTLNNSTVDTVFGGESGLEIEGNGGSVTTVLTEGLSNIKLNGTEVDNYVAGLSTAGSIATLKYEGAASAKNLILGGATVDDGSLVDVKNTIGSIDATFTGGKVGTVSVGYGEDAINGDVKLTFNGGSFEKVEFASGIKDGKVDVEFTGGTVATIPGKEEAIFVGVVYGATVGDIVGGTKGNQVLVNGHAKVNSLTGFKDLTVKGGTFNVAGSRADGNEDTVHSVLSDEENVIEISGAIENHRAIQAGSIKAGSMKNYGLVGVQRDTADRAGITLTGELVNENFIRTSKLDVGGNFTNSGEITAVGDIKVDGTFTNTGMIFIESAFDEKGVFSQDGGITLSGVDMINSGEGVFVSTGYLKGVNNLSTGKLYVTGGAEISGSITIDAGAEVAFTNKANPNVQGLTLGGSITMYDTSSLIVSGTLTSGAQTITVKADGLEGYNVLVHAADGLDEAQGWTINWGDGQGSKYGVLRSSSEIILFSADKLYVNTEFGDEYKDGETVVIDGNRYLFGVNAFATVEDAIAFAKDQKLTSASICIWHDEEQLEVKAVGYDVILDGSVVGDVFAKSVTVVSDSTADSINVSDKTMTIKADALATVVYDITAGTKIVIDASKGSGYRRVLDVEPEYIPLASYTVEVQAPVGNTTYTSQINGGDLYLKADKNTFLVSADAYAKIVDGVTVDKATGDVLFKGVNVFDKKEDAVAAAQAANGYLFLADGSNVGEAIEGIAGVVIEYTGTSDIIGSHIEEITGDNTSMVIGSSVNSKLYGLSDKAYAMGGEGKEYTYDFVLSDSVLSGTESAVYITGANVNSVINDDIYAELTNVRIVGRQDVPWGNGGWNEGIYIGYGSFGTDENNPIDINVTLRGVTSSNSGFYGIQTQPNDGTTNGSNISTSSTDPKDQVRQDINANINIKVYDSVLGGTFTVLNTNNEHWNARGASLLNTYFTSGSITVEVGNTDFGTSGNWRNIRLGASLQLGGKAIQAYNVPNTLHIVSTDNGTTTRASYINEWDTLIVDATAQLILNDDLQYSTVFGSTYTANQWNDAHAGWEIPLDEAGTLTKVMINMSGYKSGTHNVITAGGEIMTDANLSNITVIGDNDLTGQCQLAYTFSGEGAARQLKGIYVFDKADNMYVDSSFSNATSGSKKDKQELLYSYNAFSSFASINNRSAIDFANDWGGTIIVTGGEFASQDFNGNSVEVRDGASFGTITMAGSNDPAWDEATLTVTEGGIVNKAIGSKSTTFTSELDLSDGALVNEIQDFSSINVAKSSELVLGKVSGSGFSMFADSEVLVESLKFKGDEKIVIDVTGYKGSPHALITSETGIEGFDPASMIDLIATDGKKKHPTDVSKYHVELVDNSLILKTDFVTNTYANSAYDESTTGTVLPDGTYLTFGGPNANAFNDVQAAADAVGSDKYTVTVTGGEFEGPLKLYGANFVMEEGTIGGIIYGCLGTPEEAGEEDRMEDFSGKTYTILDGKIGGLDLTGANGAYSVSDADVIFGDGVEVAGAIIGAGDTTATFLGSLSAGGSVKGFAEISLDSGSFLSVGGLDLLRKNGSKTSNGIITVTNDDFHGDEGLGNNLHLLISSDTNIQNATIDIADKTLYNFKEYAGANEKTVYLLDLSRVYYDASANFTKENYDGGLYNGDLINWYVAKTDDNPGTAAYANAHNDRATAVTLANSHDATLYVRNRTGNFNTQYQVGTTTYQAALSLNIDGCKELGTIQNAQITGQTTSKDINVEITGSTFNGNGSRLAVRGNNYQADQRHHLDGDIYVSVDGSTITGGGEMLITHYLLFDKADASVEFSLTNSTVSTGIAVIKDSHRADNLANTDQKQSFVFTMENVKNYDDLLWYIAEGDYIGNGSYFISMKDVELGNGSKQITTFDGWNWGTPAGAADITFEIEGATVKGAISPDRAVTGNNTTRTGNNDNGRRETDTFTGSKTLNIAGHNEITETRAFKTIVMEAGASLIGTSLSMASYNNANNTITVDVSEETASRSFIYMSNGIANEYQLIQKGTLAPGLQLVKGSNAIYVYDGKVADIFVNSSYDGAISGYTLDNGDLLVFEKNAFSDVETAKAALTVGNKLYISGKTTISEKFYATLEEGDVTPFVDVVIQDGDFSGEDSILAVAAEDKTVTGTATIEIAGGTFGKAGVTKVTVITEDDPETTDVDETETVTEWETEPIYAKIDGSKASVGGDSTLVLSTTSKMYADIVDFDTLQVTAAAQVEGSITVDALEIDCTAGSLTVTADPVTGVGGLTVTSKKILLDISDYDGKSKIVLSAGKDIDYTQYDITVKTASGDPGQTYVDKDNNLWVVSDAPGNVYFKDTFSHADDGDTIGSDLLIYNSNAFSSLTAENIGLHSNPDYSIYIIDGDFTDAEHGGSMVDLTNFGKANIVIDGGKVTGFILDNGGEGVQSRVEITGKTSAGTIGSLKGAEGDTVGYRLIAGKDATVESAEGVQYVRFGAGQNVAIGKLVYLENGGELVADMSGWTAGAGTVLTVAGGIENFIQYETVGEGETAKQVSHTRVGATNNANDLMLYLSGDNKSILAVAPGKVGYVGDFDTSINGTKAADDASTTLVYGYNAGSNGDVGRYITEGGTIYIKDVQSNPGMMATYHNINAVIENSVLGAAQFGVTGNQQTRSGDFTLDVTAGTFTAATAFAGRGESSDEAQRVNLAIGEIDENGAITKAGKYTLSFNGGRHNDNAFHAALNANIGGGEGSVVDVSFTDYYLRGNIELFDNVWNYVDKDNNTYQLDTLNVTLTRVTTPQSKWVWFWEPREANETTINITITDSLFEGDGQNDYTVGIFGHSTTENGWTGTATMTISGFTMSQGRLSGAKGINESDPDKVSSGTRILHVVSGQTNNVGLVKMFNKLEFDKGTFLAGSTISLPDNTEIILRGDAGYEGEVLEYAVVGTSVTAAGAATVKFVDENDNDIEGYKGAIGAKNLFVYKTTGDVYYSNEYGAEGAASTVNGTAVTEADGSKNFLVVGDNAVGTMKDADASLKKRENATLIIKGANDASLYLMGYTTIVEGGAITNLYGGNAPDTTDPAAPVAGVVDSVDITVNKDATITNITVANELSTVSENATVLIADGAAFSGTIDGGSAYVGGTSDLTFAGSASAKSITGFDSVTIKADSLVALSGGFTGTSITIDATGFTDYSKKVLTVGKGGFDPAAMPTVTVKGDEGVAFDYEFITNADETIALVVKSPASFVTDTFANSAWTDEENPGGTFIGDTLVAWKGNAFSSAADAAAAIGVDGTLYLTGTFAGQDVTLSGNDVIFRNEDPKGSTEYTIGNISSTGTLTVNGTLTAASLTGLTAVNMKAAKTGAGLTVTGIAALDDKAVITIDVTDYIYSADNNVLLTAGEGSSFENATITLTGEGKNGLYAYASGNKIVVKEINTLYIDNAFGEDGSGTPATDTHGNGDELIFGVNAFYSLNTAGSMMKDGQTIYVDHRNNGDVHTQDKQVSKLIISDSTRVNSIIAGHTTGQRAVVDPDHNFYGDVEVTIDNSLVALTAESWLVNRGDGTNGWNHRNTIFGNVNVNVNKSEIGGTDAQTLHIFNYTYVADPDAETKSAINVNFVDTNFNANLRFFGDSPTGAKVPRRIKIDDEDATPNTELGTGATETINISLDNVTVADGRTWAIRGGGSQDIETGGTYTVDIKNSSFGEGARFAIEENWGNWNNGDGQVWDTPHCGADFIFNLDSSTINGYLVAGRLDAGDDSHDTTPFLPDYTGSRVLTVKGQNYVKNALYFNTVTLDKDASLTGDVLSLYSNAGSDKLKTVKISIDASEYTGASKVYIATKLVYDDEGNASGGIENFNPDKNLNSKAAEGYTFVTDYDKKSKTISAIVLKGAIKDIYVDSAFNAKTAALGTSYEGTGEALFYLENAFSSLAPYEDPETEEDIPGALDALKDGATLYVVGGKHTTNSLKSNSITVDGTARLTYNGKTAITINGDVVVGADATFMISAKGFAGQGTDVTVLTANSITEGSISTDSGFYTVQYVKEEGTGIVKEVHLKLNATKVYLNVAWKDLPDGEPVDIEGGTATLGVDAFADEATAINSVAPNGSVSVIKSAVDFTGLSIGNGLTVTVDGLSSVNGGLVDAGATMELAAGSSATNIGVAGTLTVGDGVSISGLGLQATANVTFADTASLDLKVGDTVANFGKINGAPTLTITIDPATTGKNNTYKLATGVADTQIAMFQKDIVVLSVSGDIIGTLAGDQYGVAQEFADNYYYTLAVEDGVLNLTKKVSVSTIYINTTDAWKDAVPYVTTVKADGNDVLFGEQAFNTTADAVGAATPGKSTFVVVGGAASFTDGLAYNTTVRSGASITGSNLLADVTLDSGASLDSSVVYGNLIVSDGATLNGKNEFKPGEGAVITVNGTIAFDTKYVDEASAQIVGLSQADLTNAKFTLTVTGEVKSGDSFVLATGVADGFVADVKVNGTTGAEVVLTVNGGAQTVNGLSYALTAAEGNLTFSISDRPTPTLVYVNSLWTETDKVIIDGVEHEIGYDAFKNGDLAYAGVTDDGAIRVLDGTVSFKTTSFAKTLTVDAGATLIDKASFADGASITINGSILFSTAIATSTDAQITGFSNIAFGEAASINITDKQLVTANYVLTDALSEGFVLPTAITVDGTAITVGGDSIKNKDVSYTLALDDNNALVLHAVKDEPIIVKPTEVYVNNAWINEESGATVTLSDGKTKKVIGDEAFASYEQAVGVVDPEGTVIIDGGEIAFTDMTMKTLVNADATVTGKAAFTAETAITINGTFLFDTAIAAEGAQLTGYSFVNGTTTKYALIDVINTSTADNREYILATDAASFNKAITVNGEKDITLEAGARVAGYDYALTLDSESGELALTVTKAADLPSDVYVNNAWMNQTGEVDIATTGEKGTIGYNAFGTYDEAFDGVAAGGTITIDGGDIAFANGLKAGVTTIVGAAATVNDATKFDKAITVNGTIALSNAYTIDGISNVNLGETGAYTLAIPNTSVGEYLIATDAAALDAMSFEVGAKVLTVNGGAVEFGDYKYELTLGGANNALTLAITSEQPVVKPTDVYVNAAWMNEASGATVTLSDGETKKTVGTDAFGSYDLAIAGVADENGTITIDGGDITFSSVTTKAATVVGAAATINGESTFDNTITVNGTIQFSTSYLINGLSKVEGTPAAYTLVAGTTVPGTTIKIATDAAGMDGKVVKYGSYDLVVNGEATLVSTDLKFQIATNADNDLVLSVTSVGPVPPPTEKTIYVDSSWTPLAPGSTVDVPGGLATIGIDAFATGDAAAEAAGEGDKIEVLGGSVSFSEPITEPITVDATATLTGNADIAATITVNGTFKFDTAFAVEGPQYTGLDNVVLGEGGAYRLAIANPLEEATYILATGAADFTGPITFTINGEDKQMELGKRIEINGTGYAYEVIDDALVLTVVNVDDGPDDGADFIDQKGNNWLISKDKKTLNETFGQVELSKLGQTIQVDKKFSVVEGEYTNCVNKNEDKLDYTEIVIDDPAKLALTVTSNSAGKVTLYKVTYKSSTGKYSTKSVKSASFKQQGNLYVGTITNALLSQETIAEKGDSLTRYYVAVQSTKKTDGFYNVALQSNTDAVHFYTDADNGWNDTLVVSKQVNPLVYNDENPVELNADTTNVQLDDAGSTAHDVVINGQTVTLTNYVGFGDDTDFKKISLDDPASVSFEVTATNAAKFIIYKVTYNETKRTYSMKALQTTTLKKQGNGTYYYAETSAYKLPLAAANEEYFVAVKSTNASKGNEAFYNVVINDADPKGNKTTFFTDADYSVQYESGNNWLLAKDKKSINTTLAEAQLLVAGEEVQIDADEATAKPGYKNYVGFGDDTDYRQIKVGETGARLQFKLSATDAAKLVVYQVTRNVNTGKYSTKALQTLTLKSAGETQSPANKFVDFLADGSKDAKGNEISYYLMVQSTNATKNAGHDAHYSVEVLATNSDALVADTLSFAQNDTDVLAGTVSDLADLNEKTDWQSIAKLA